MMVSQQISFYKDKVAVNLLAKDLDNALAVQEALDGHSLIGILSNKFNNIPEAVSYINTYKESIHALSIGLGGGDPSQWEKAAKLAALTQPAHVNQVYPCAGYTLGLLQGCGAEQTLVNALLSPTGIVGKVNLSTGPVSSKAKTKAIVDIDTALSMFHDAGLNSVKFFHIHGDQCLDELKEVAEACTRNGIEILEPTGGITEQNLPYILETCIEAGCQKVIPHVYSSAIDPGTGLTDIQTVESFYHIVRDVVN